MTPFLGEIKLLPWDFAPKGWAVCAGQLLAVSQNQALFSLLGVMYGGNGATTFALPDLRGRAAIERTPERQQGLPDGTETVTLTVATMPAHTHAIVATSSAATQHLPGLPPATFGTDNSPESDFFAADSNPLLAISPATVSQVGGGQAHANMQPYLVLTYCIALHGVFPARN